LNKIYNQEKTILKIMAKQKSRKERIKSHATRTKKLLVEQQRKIFLIAIILIVLLVLININRIDFRIL